MRPKLIRRSKAGSMIMTMMDDELITAIGEAARRAHKSRSLYIQETMQEKLEREKAKK